MCPLLAFKKLLPCTTRRIVIALLLIALFYGTACERAAAGDVEVRDKGADQYEVRTDDGVFEIDRKPFVGTNAKKLVVVDALLSEGTLQGQLLYIVTSDGELGLRIGRVDGILGRKGAGYALKALLLHLYPRATVESASLDGVNAKKLSDCLTDHLIPNIEALSSEVPAMRFAGYDYTLDFHYDHASLTMIPNGSTQSHLHIADPEAYVKWLSIALKERGKNLRPEQQLEIVDQLKRPTGACLLKLLQ